MSETPSWSRRQFLGSAAAAALAPLAPPLRGKAEHCLFLWLGGGMAHIDTFDPKKRGNPKTKSPGCYYDTIPTAQKGVRVCEHLSRTARVLDRMTIVRTLFHQTIDEHATATHFVHTGRRISETIQYPSIGSIVAHEMPRPERLPPYVVIGYPNASRDPGFLGPRCGYLHLTDLEAGPAGFVRHEDVNAGRQKRREELLSVLRRRAKEDPGLAGQDEVIGQFQRLAGDSFRHLFDLRRESGTLRESYGGAFGQRCLLARRLVEAGVRFVEVSFNLNFVNGTGWDTHNQGQLKQHLLIQELDTALTALVLDLEQRRLLDRVLVVVATEFGRPPEFDGGGGRGHHAKCFSVVLAGGGLRHGQVIGQTDELARKTLHRPVSVPDFLATICCALGIDPAKELYQGSRPVPITDDGKPIRELFG